MPVDQARFIDLVDHAYAKWLADIGRDAVRAVGLPYAIDRGRLSVHDDIAALQLQDCPGHRVAARPAGGRGLRLCHETKAGRRSQGAHHNGTAGQHGEASLTKGFVLVSHPR